MDLERTTKLIKLHEGSRSHAYNDLSGKAIVPNGDARVTIGVGRNIDVRGGPGLRDSEIEHLLFNDIQEGARELEKTFPWFVPISDVRKAVLIDMRHNLGMERLLKFEQTLKLIGIASYRSAATQMLKSLWAKQVGQRAERLAHMMAVNEWPEVIE